MMLQERNLGGKEKEDCRTTFLSSRLLERTKGVENSLLIVSNAPDRTLPVHMQIAHLFLFIFFIFLYLLFLFCDIKYYCYLYFVSVGVQLTE